MDTQNPAARPAHYCLPGTTTSIVYDLAWMLLTAQKERRLDLALASVMCPWKMELAETVQEGKRVLVPVWYFEQYPGNSRYHFSHTPYSNLPGVKQLLSDRVPYYSRSSATDCSNGADTRLRDWLAGKGIYVTLFYHQPLAVQLTSKAGRTITVKEPEGLELPCSEVRMATLLARATVKFLAPDLLPYLESDVMFPAPDLVELASQEARKPLYQVVLLPVMLGLHGDRQCIYQKWDPQLECLFSCLALKKMRPQEEEEEDEYTPEQCPCCGGYYCEYHFSHVQQEFMLTQKEIACYGKRSAALRICCHCALLEEPIRLAVRCAFLQANKEKQISECV